MLSVHCTVESTRDGIQIQPGSTLLHLKSTELSFLKFSTYKVHVLNLHYTSTTV